MAIQSPNNNSYFACKLCFLFASALWLFFNIFLFGDVYFVRRFKSNNFLSNSVVDSPNKYLAGRSLINVSSTRKHGVVGMKTDGMPAWLPAKHPGSNLEMASVLRSGGGFNLLLSDALPLDRNVADKRPSQCRNIAYPSESLRPASVIIVFYNEPFSTLMRSVHSVLNLTPPSLLQEIILVDDGSDLDWIRKDGTKQLEEYVAVLNKATDVKIVRLPIRKGIVGARMAGIRAAVAPIFVILDSHIEVQDTWLEPLVSRITQDRTRVVMPSVDAVNPETFEFQNGGIGCVLGFLWKLIEHGFDPNSKSPLRRRQPHLSTDFIDSPTMAGGLLAADKRFFMELGGYDEQFTYWGTENLEISFKTWMCGGSIECSPCSRVFHIFRKGGVGYSSPTDAVTKNKMRLLTIWMDEYADLAWKVIGSPRINFGSYKENLDWRKKHCKSFKWFLENVYPEFDVQAMPEDVPYLGPLQNAETNLCLDTRYNDVPGESVVLSECYAKSNSQGFMYFRSPQHIMPVSNDESCLGHDQRNAGLTGWCQSGEQLWDILAVEGQSSVYLLKHIMSKNCLAISADGKMLVYAECVTSGADPKQTWVWAEYHPPENFTPPPPPILRGNLFP